jgi:superfamily I DNA and/or RNA helicase
LKEDTLIACHNLVPVDENKYQAKSESLIVIEPDFLVDASAISECFNNTNTDSYIFFLTRLLSELVGPPAFKGIIVGYYLDELVRNQDLDYNQIFVDYKKANPLEAAYLGNEVINDIKQSIHSEHRENIKNLVHTLINKKLNLWIEPTFFSEMYGLQGRLDLLAIDFDNSKNIIELKSGKDPFIGMEWNNHKMQVVAYNMMLESTYESYRGTNEIFYSKSSQPRRYITSQLKEKKELIKVRNEIVATIYQLAKKDFSSLDKLKIEGITDLPRYNLKRLQSFQENFDSSRLTTQYYQELMAFTLRELINAKVSNIHDSYLEEKHNSNIGFSSLWSDDFLTKQENYRIIRDLKIINIEKNKSYINFKCTHKNIPHSFRVGDMVIIHPKSSDNYNPLKQHIFKGTIKEINQDEVTVSLFNKQNDYSFIEQYSFWAIEPDIFERNYWNTISSLFEVLSCSMEKKKILFGHLEPTSKNISYKEDNNLTDHQSKVVNQALISQNYYILQGPPGTGKTSIFLVNYVQKNLKISSEKIFVLAFTNKAVEQICKAFKNPRYGEPIEYLRLGNKTTVDQNLISTKMNGDDADQWRFILEKNRVFITTVSTFKSRYLLLKNIIKKFDQLIVDEASQLTEADLAGIVVLFNKFVLIGDQKQLPAVITQSGRDCLVKTKEFSRYNINFTDLRMSLFERLITNAKAKGWDHCYGQLTEHYRMHRDIASLIVHHYDRQLVEQREQQREIELYQGDDVNYLLKELSKSRTIFMETPSEIGMQRNNTNEAIIAATIVKIYWENKLLPMEEIGIIAPFRAQVAEINQQLERILGNADLPIVVDTVERFQGDERELIIFSTTISWSKQVANIQSIADHDRQGTDRKLLVSISRAKSKLVILGNSSQLQFAPAYRELIKHIEQGNGLIDLEIGQKIVNAYGGEF